METIVIVYDNETDRTKYIIAGCSHRCALMFLDPFQTYGSAVPIYAR